MRRKRNKLLEWFLKPFRGSINKHVPDYFLLIITGLLLFFGLLFLSSASAPLAFYKHNQETYYFLKQQILHGLIPGLIIFYLALRIDYFKYQKYYPYFLIATIILLLTVFIPGLKTDYGQANSWIYIGSVSFQTSELAKLTLIIFLAGWFNSSLARFKYWQSGLLPFSLLLLTIAILLAFQPDFGTLIIFVLIALSMYFVIGAPLKHLGIIIAAGLLGLFIAVKTAPYRLDRFTAFLNPEIDPQGISWQIKQALIAVGSGHYFGLGIGQSRQKFRYLPEPAGDSIFAIIAEELGFIFTLLFLSLFVFLMLRGFKIIRNSNDNFAKLIALGITIWLTAQVFINIAALIGLLPLTGVPLPFVSLGGSNLMVTLLSIGLLANISKFTKKYE